MHLSTDMLLIFGVVDILCFIAGYFAIRNLLWSIIWCDKKGKHRTLRRLKCNKSTLEIIKMDYLLVHTTEHKKSFSFWLKIKKIYIFLEFFLLIAYFILCIVPINNIICEWFAILIVFQSVVLSFVFVFQTDIHRDTKYDRLRQNSVSRRKK